MHPPAAHKAEVDALLEKKVIAFTAEDSHRFGSPNCEAAGKAGAFMGLWAMMSTNGGSGNSHLAWQAPRASEPLSADAALSESPPLKSL